MTDPLFVYVGNWKIDGQGLGITVCTFDTDLGRLEPVETVRPDICVGSILIDHAKGLLYCADERSDNPDFGAGYGGRVFAFRIDQKTGRLTELNHRPAYASLTSYVATDIRGRYLLATNHARPIRITKAVRTPEGTFSIHAEADPATTVLFPLDRVGRIGDACDIHLHNETDPSPGAHTPAAHCVVPSTCGGFFVVCDKGTDTVSVFRIDYDTDKLDLLGTYDEPAQSAPRYAAFHPSGSFVYINHEKQPFLSTYRISNGSKLELLARTDLELGTKTIAGEASDLLFDPMRRNLYCLVRKLNCICVFKADPFSGTLEQCQILDLAGDNPRSAAFTPDGKFLLVAQVGTADVAVIPVNADGTLSSEISQTPFTRPGHIAVADPQRIRTTSQQ